MLGIKRLTVFLYNYFAQSCRPFKKKRPYTVSAQSPSTTSSPSSSSFSNQPTRLPHPARTPNTTPHSRPPAPITYRTKLVASSAFSARHSAPTAPPTRPTVVAHATKLPSQSKYLPPAKNHELYLSTPSPPSSKQRSVPGSSLVQTRTTPSRVSPNPKRSTSAIVPGTSPRRPNQASRKISLSDLRIDTMSVSSTVSVDSTSSAESNRPEVRAPQMQKIGRASCRERVL